MSLVHCCIDFMSWNWDRRFGINMLLPNTMTTIHSVAEIRRVFAPTYNRSPVGLINLGNNTIERGIHDYWLKDVSHRKYEVQLLKLTDQEISLWDKSVRPDAWKDIDPYSDLEDVGNTSNDITSDSKDVQHEQEADKKYDLRIRTVKPRIPSRPLRRASASVKYTQNDSDNDITALPRKKPCKPRVDPSGPSTARIAARGMRSVAPITTHPIRVHQPLKAETESSSDSDSGSDTEPYDPVNLDESGSSDDNIPLSELKKKDPQSSSTITKRKSEFVTRRVGLKKHRRTRSYKCPVCGSKFVTQGELNEHYRQSHDKIKCSKCSQVFTTPSTLVCHYYTHAAPRKFCWCGQGFYFRSEFTCS